MKSKSTSSYFGSYASLKAAELDAEEANREQKNGQDDWEPEEKAPKAIVELSKLDGAIFQARQALMKVTFIANSNPWKDIQSALHESLDHLNKAGQLVNHYKDSVK